MDKIVKSMLEAEKIESQDENYGPYPATQPISQMRFDSYDKLQSGAPGKPAPKQGRA